LNHGDELEGFTIPSWDWIVMSANPGGGMFSYSRGRMEWFSTVFAHEFAHVVSLKAYRATAEPTFLTAVGGLYQNGINRPITKDVNGKVKSAFNDASIGFELPIADSDSVWWVEGGAEFWSSTTNVNWWTTARDRTIRTSVMEDRLLTYEEWHHKVTAGWNDGERWYQGGHSFALYLRDRFNDPELMAKFAKKYAEGWRPLFETVVEDVTGVDCETLYNDWLAYITERYDDQYNDVKAKGEVAGWELLASRPEWEYKTPEERDAWLGDKEGLFGDNARHWFGRKTAREREAAKEATGTYQYDPRTSDDGEWVGWVKRGSIIVKNMDGHENRGVTGAAGPADAMGSTERAMQSFSVPYAAFDHGWDFTPSNDGIVLTGHEESHPRNNMYALTKVYLEKDGYDWKQLVYYKFPEMVEESQGKNLKYSTRRPSKGFFNKRQWHGEWNPIPNTMRGHDPAVSPDGNRIAFLQYTDGTVNLATINFDGSDKKLLTEYKDGNWMRIVDWSPDGKQLVFMMFRNFQQNLYLVNADGSGEITPIMMDEWEEQDPHWAQDGKIYFCADPGGIDNIYSYDPKTGKILQITNVITGAVSPHITADGDLVYNHYTANGWKIYTLGKNEFLNDDVTHLFNLTPEKEHVDGFLADTLDLSKYEEMTRDYSPLKSMSSPVFIPMMRLQNQSLTKWGLQSGAQFQMMDYAQLNQIFAFGLLGENTILQAGYTNDMFTPSLMMYGGHFQGKSDQGYLLDLDENPDTTDDQNIYEVKRLIMQNFGGAAISYQWNGLFNTTFGVSGFDFSLKGVDDTQFNRFMWSATPYLNLTWSNNSWLSRSINPYYGRSIELTLTHGYTDIVYEDTGSVTVDDGEQMDKYHYNQLEFRWNEILPIPSFGSKILGEAQQRRHVIYFDTHVGLTDRNVSNNDEFRAGGRHPYNFGYGSIQPNSQFAGYPSWSLSGENLLIFNTGYRFPLTRPEARYMKGPFYMVGLVGQISATAGNLWSYRPPSDPSDFYRSRYNERIAYNTDDIHRERPFMDTAYKNGNSMLYDLSAEIRMSSQLYHTMGWDSFIRVAYGFNEVRGFGDVNGDDIFDTNNSALGDELSNETEPSGIRLYLGLGTGW